MLVREWLTLFAGVVERDQDELNRLDAALGDGDYGASMHRGATATVSALEGQDIASVGEVMRIAGAAIVEAIGGTSGPLFGTLFLKAGISLSDAEEVTPGAFADALNAGAEGVMALGGAAVGDKTMIDALIPGVDALERGARNGDDVVDWAAAAAEVATDAAAATADLAARRGRASYTGSGGKGHVDPGAQGISLLFQSFHAAATTAANGT